MSIQLTSNATDFEMKFRQVRDRYRRIYIPLTEKWRALREKPVPASDEEARERGLELIEQEILEYQIRVWVIDGLLRSLNWIQNTAWNDPPEKANMIPEMTVQSVRGTKRRLDYFGFESETRRPLLVVEAKRPGDTLPVPIGGADVESYTSVIARTLKGEKILSGEWIEWLESLRDYCVSIKQQVNEFPARVVLTNGDWCIVFKDPSRTFSSVNGMVGAEDIAVFRSADDVLLHSSEVFALLEHQLVVGERPEILPGHMPSVLDVNEIEKCAFALRLRYSESLTANSSTVPVITVVPLLLVKSSGNTWVRISGTTDARQLPLEKTQNHLDYHLESVRRDAQALLADVERQLGRQATLCAVEEHFRDTEAFNARAAITKSGDCWIILTGNHTHFLYSTPTFHDCLFHEWTICREAGVAAGTAGVYGKMVTSPRAFFESGRPQHCAHRDVLAAKQSQVTPANRPRAGARSAKDFGAFCEIAPFEEYLCCRSCVYQEVCTSSEMLKLPCTTALPTRMEPSLNAMVNIGNAEPSTP